MPTTPVFPLNTPLMPGCTLSLQIFEKRYLDMIADCTRKNSGFAVALLAEGQERHEVFQRNKESGNTEVSVTTVPFYTTGTLATIIDFDQQDNGLLQVLIEGNERCKLENVGCDSSGLWQAQWQPNPENGHPSEQDHEVCVRLLENFITEESRAILGIDLETLTVSQSMNFLITFMPFTAAIKQALLETDNLADRASHLRLLMRDLVDPAPKQ